MLLEKAIERVSKDFTADNVSRLVRELKTQEVKDIECYGFTNDCKLVVRCDDEVREMTVDELVEVFQLRRAA